jgi:hypothetical protein
MLWEIKAAEDLKTGDFVEFVTDQDGSKLSCKKALKPESITAMAARDVVKSEMLTFDTDNDTKDLAKLKEPFSRQ